MKSKMQIVIRALCVLRPQLVLPVAVAARIMLCTVPGHFQSRRDFPPLPQN